MHDARREIPRRSCGRFDVSRERPDTRVTRLAYSTPLPPGVRSVTTEVSRAVIEIVLCEKRKRQTLRQTRRSLEEFQNNTIHTYINQREFTILHLNQRESLGVGGRLGDPRDTS